MLEPKRKRVGVIVEGKAPPVVSGVLDGKRSECNELEKRWNRTELRSASR